MVRLQQAAWAILMIALAVTAQATTGNAGGLLPIILVATYPGLQLFSNRVTSYFVALHKSAFWPDRHCEAKCRPFRSGRQIAKC